jgi:hypothetical protein
VHLHLYNPRVNNHKLTASDLFDLKYKHPILKRFTLSDTDASGKETIILAFENVEDAVDFQQEEK